MNLEQMLETGLKIPGIKSFFPIIPPCFTWYLFLPAQDCWGTERKQNLQNNSD